MSFWLEAEGGAIGSPSRPALGRAKEASGHPLGLEQKCPETEHPIAHSADGGRGPGNWWGGGTGAKTVPVTASGSRGHLSTPSQPSVQGLGPSKWVTQ